MATKSNEAAQKPEADAAGTRVRWDTSNLKSVYANVCAVNSTREEVVLNFGINKAWERTSNEMEIELTSRIILSPFAAQRLHELLGKLLKEYDSRYGALPQQPTTVPSTGTTRQ
jgi:hypothetical protein